MTPLIKVVITAVQVNPECAIRNLDVYLGEKATWAHYVIIENTPVIAANTAWDILAGIAKTTGAIISHPNKEATIPDTEAVYLLKENPDYGKSHVAGLVLELQP